MTHDVSRRDFLASAAALTGAAALSGLAPSRLLAQQAATQKGAGKGPPMQPRVLFIAFAGGVRSKEVIGNPSNVPNLMRIAARGCVLPNMAASNVGHFGATLSLFTGNTEYMGIRENERSTNPTLFEYLRKDLQFPASDCWLSTAGGAQARLYSHSMHADYGEPFAANLIDGDGVFNAEFKALVDRLGRPRVDSPQEEKVMERLQGALGPRTEAAPNGANDKPGGTANDTAARRRIEKFIVDELTGNTARITGPGSGDAKAIAVGANIFRIFRPRVMAITLQGHDVAHGSYNGYVEVIRRNDAEIGKLWDAVQADPDLKATTHVFVMPEFGRDRNLNERQGLDHGDGSDDLRKVFLVAAGPQIKAGKVMLEEYPTVAAAPTVLSMFNGKARFSRAHAIRGLFA